jgi:hypothetical protein
MSASYRVRIVTVPPGIQEAMNQPRRALGLLLAAAVLLSSRASGETAFVGYITDTECGPDHAPMIAKGGMGAEDRACTYRCVEKGATFGFVDEDRQRFFQLDDQSAPRPYAGQKVRVTGVLRGDTILVTAIERVE